MNRRILPFIVFITCLSGIKAQEFTSSTGDSYAYSDFQADWPIGEEFTQTGSPESYAVNQGVHQNYYVITSSHATKRQDIQITPYPNPVTDKITLMVNLSSGPQTGKVTVTDVQGKVWLQEEISGTKNELNVENFSPGIYFVSVQFEDLVGKSFKIVKQ
jgi:hypothetical protein